MPAIGVIDLIRHCYCHRKIDKESFNTSLIRDQDATEFRSWGGVPPFLPFNPSCTTTITRTTLNHSMIPFNRGVVEVLLKMVKIGDDVMEGG